MEPFSRTSLAMKTQKPAVRRLGELVPGAPTSMWCVSLPDAAANKWSALNAVKLSPAMRGVHSVRRPPRWRRSFEVNYIAHKGMASVAIRACAPAALMRAGMERDGFALMVMKRRSGAVHGRRDGE